MVKNNLRVWKIIGKRQQIRQLRVVQPRVKTQAELCQLRKAFAKHRVRQPVRGHGPGQETLEFAVVVIRRRITDTAQTPTGNRSLRLEHLLHGAAQHQVGMADDGFGHTAFAVNAAGRHGRIAIGKLDLAHRLHVHRAKRAVHGMGFDIHRGADVVALRNVGEQVVQQVAVGRCPDIPQVVVCVDDGQFRFQCRLARR